jgi:biopolymer transport protein ExbD
MHRRKRKELAQSSDIAFLLIIFFLLLAGLDVSKALSYRQAKPAGETVETSPLSLTLEDDDTLRYQNQPISLSQCKELLDEAGQLTLTVDDHATWQGVVDILSIAEESHTKVVLHATT